MATVWTLEDIADLVTRYRYVVGTEAEFQDGLARVLATHQIEHNREHDLGKTFGRIDFYIPGRAIGIELKVRGSPSEVMRQLHRYALCPAIDALILVTIRVWPPFVPKKINGKPLLTAAVWQGQF